jgi:lysophospholipase L1-like esterase
MKLGVFMRFPVRRAAVCGLALLLTASGVALGTGPAQAAGTWTLNVVALGDSFGSGTGAGDYLGGTGVANGCWRSANSYSEVAVARTRAMGIPVSFTNATCSGATTTEIREPYRGQPPQLDALRADTNVVYLSVGTSDIDFAGYGTQCVVGDCSGAVSDAEIAELPGMGQNVAALVADIKARSPRAKVVMTGYGSMLTAGANAPGVTLDQICDPGFFSSQERIDGNRVVSALDATLRRTAQQAGATYASPYLSNSVDLHPSFAGHSLCAGTDPYYRGFEALSQEGVEAVLHLNKTGQAALADLVLSTGAPAPFGVVASEAAGASASGRATVVIGDDLVFGMAQPLANLLTGTTSRVTWVAASAGASVPNFVNGGWLDNPSWGGPNLATIEEYNRFLGAKITVIALGTNDVRLMADAPSQYTRSQHAAALATAIQQAKTSSTCVFLVNPADHAGPSRSDEVAAVDQNITAATGGKVFRIDWKGYSAGHEDWFAGTNDPHHSQAGRLLYADLIHRSVLDQIQAGRC